MMKTEALTMDNVVDRFCELRNLVVAARALVDSEDDDEQSAGFAVLEIAARLADEYVAEADMASNASIAV